LGVLDKVPLAAIHEKVHFPLTLELLEDRTLPSSSNIPAIVVLDPVSKGALTLTGNGAIVASGGGSEVIDDPNLAPMARSFP
jgi:hypothetical protein